MTYYKEGTILKIDQGPYKGSYLFALDCVEAVISLQRDLWHRYYKVSLVTEVFCKEDDEDLSNRRTL